MSCQWHLVEAEVQQGLHLRDHLGLGVVLEKCVPGGPAHWRGGVEAVREGRYPMEEGEEEEKHGGEQMRSEESISLSYKITAIRSHLY